MQEIEQTIFERILEEEEVSKGGYNPQEALLKVEVEDKVGEPSDAEVAQMYEQFKSRLEGMTLEIATPLIVQQLMRQKQGEQFQTYLDELKTNLQRCDYYPTLIYHAKRCQQMMTHFWGRMARQ